MSSHCISKAKVRCTICKKRYSKSNISAHLKSHGRWKTPELCQVCRKPPSYDHFPRHVLTHYTFDSTALNIDKESGGNYPMVFLLHHNKFKEAEPRPVVIFFNWDDGDRDVAPF